MILLENKNVVQLSIDWITTYPWLLFPFALGLIFLLMHGDNFFVKRKKPIKTTSFMEILDTSSPSTFDGLSQTQLNYAEALLGYKLPNLLKEQLQIKNGGATYRFRYQVKGNSYDVVGDKSLFINSLLGIDTKFSFDLVSKQISILSSIQFWEQETLPSEMVMVAELGSGWLMLDYTHSIVSPTVKYWNPSLKKDILIAPSWEAFCEGLRPMGD